jgi:hypothetical protein
LQHQTKIALALASSALSALLGTASTHAKIEGALMKVGKCCNREFGLVQVNLEKKRGGAMGQKKNRSTIRKRKEKN